MDSTKLTNVNLLFDLNLQYQSIYLAQFSFHCFFFENGGIITGTQRQYIVKISNEQQQKLANL